MRISKKAYYGLRAITALATEGELSVHDMALAENMPEEYLHKILQILKGCLAVLFINGNYVFDI